MPVIVVAVINRWWWRCEQARDRSHSAADCGTEGRAMTAGSGGPDCRPTPGADETTANGPLDGIVWIGARRNAQEQPGRNDAGDNS
jgi:hypothetical protein